jgi:transcriptional regulator with XRE-family HTH domain
MTFADEVFSRRRALGLSQTDVASALGVSIGTINKIEHGRIKATSKTSKKLAELLQLDSPANHAYITGYKDVDLAILEKRINNAIDELELILDIVRVMKGENTVTGTTSSE